MLSRVRKWNASKRIIIGISAFIIVAILMHLTHALTLDRTVWYREISYSSPKISQDVCGLRIAFVSDTHEISKTRLEQIVNRLNEENLDLLLLGGDMSTGGGLTCIELLSQIETTYGIFGVDGNHDNRERLFENMRNHGITPLVNDGLHIGENFFLAGVVDYRRASSWGKGPEIDTATAKANEEDFVLLISHNADNLMHQDTSRVDLTLSGHTHGGQINFFGVWAPALGFVTNHPDRFKSGWSECDQGSSVFISNGAGEYFPRIFARPDVVILTLLSE